VVVIYKPKINRPFSLIRKPQKAFPFCLILSVKITWIIIFHCKRVVGPPLGGIILSPAVRTSWNKIWVSSCLTKLLPFYQMPNESSCVQIVQIGPTKNNLIILRETCYIKIHTLAE